MRRFELIDEKSRKFWEVDVLQTELTVRFGRLGTAGTTRRKNLDSNEAAASEAVKLIREKTSKGYVEVDFGIVAAKRTVTNEPRALAPLGLSQLELDTIAGLLELAVPEYEGHGSNDYFVPASDGTRSVIVASIEYGNRVLAASDMHRFGDFLESDGEIFIWDSWLMSWLAHRCRAIVAATKSPAAFSEAESEILAALLDYLAVDDCQFFQSDSGGEDFSLSASVDHKGLLIAAAGHAGKNAQVAAIRAVKDPDDLVSVYALDVLRWLAVRSREAIGHAPELLARPEERLEVLKGWISEKTLMKRAVEQDESWIPAYAKNDADRETYAIGGNPFREYDVRARKETDVPMRPPFARDVRSKLLRHEEFKRTRAVVLSLFGNRPVAEWQREYDRLVAYRFWGVVTEIHAQGHVEFGALAAVLVECVYLGCMEQANYLAALLHWSFKNGTVRMDDALPLYQWSVRLCFAYFELDFEPARYPAYAQRKDLYAKDECFGESILNELAVHWREPDLAPLTRQLTWLCDYYTHRTRYTSTPVPKTELGNDSIPARLPIAVLAWFRLREFLGLTNPDIDHPLMKARYAILYTPRPFFTEPVLEGILARLRRDELPTLGDLDDPTILEPKKWRIWDYSLESAGYAAVEFEGQSASGIALHAQLPKGWTEHSLPEMARFLEPKTGTVFCFSAYQTTGIAARDWAQIILSSFERSSPAAQRVVERYPVASQQWFGMAEEFCGVTAAHTEPRYHLVVAGKSSWALLTLHVVANPDVFDKRGDFYRWLIHWNVYMSDPYAIAVIPPSRQDVPGFVKIAPDASWTDADKQFAIGLRHFQGLGADEAAKAATRDRALAATWFERAAEQDHGKAQFTLAVQLKNGDGVPQDLPKATHWCKKARLRGVESAGALLEELESKARSAKPFWKIW